MASGYVVLTLTFSREDDQWIGECEELGVGTFGDSLDEVRAELEELVQLDLNGLEAIGERERFFAEHGIELFSIDEPAPSREYSLQPDGCLLEPKRVIVGA
jgi:predicted RNase H-like HicB family nuclease